CLEVGGVGTPRSSRRSATVTSVVVDLHLFPSTPPCARRSPAVAGSFCDPREKWRGRGSQSATTSAHDHLVTVPNGRLLPQTHALQHYLWTSCSSATPGQAVPRFGGLGCSLKLWWLRPCNDLGQHVSLTLAWTFGPA